MEVMIDWSQLLPLVLLTWNETRTFFDSSSFFCFEFEEMSKMKKESWLLSYNGFDIFSLPVNKNLSRFYHANLRHFLGSETKLSILNSNTGVRIDWLTSVMTQSPIFKESGHLFSRYFKFSYNLSILNFTFSFTHCKPIPCNDYRDLPV